ncbi:SH3 domain-containing protein [Thalassobius sp. S69A]|uniref:SH3 domain-containing protein n=1 Tax=unclassified Thalassovita TaxID=2619711 RepID=UPI003C7C7547
MLRYILLTFVFLGWAFYEASGGTEFTADLQAKKELAAAKAAQDAAEKAEAAALAQREIEVPAAMVTRAAFDPAEVTPPAQSDAQPAATPDPEAKDDPEIATIDETPAPDIRKVAGSRVNMRMGPATSYNIVLRLTRGTRVQVLQEPGNGWVKLRVEENGRVGWMASRLLTKVPS